MKANFQLTITVVLLLIISASAFAQEEVSYQNLSREEIQSELLPIREVRKTAVWFNMGWNGIVGFGPVVSLYVVPKIAADVGIGLSSTGVKLSARARYLFNVKNFTPFVGLGFMNGMGSKTSFELKDAFNNNEPFTLKIENSPYLQLSGGFEYMAKKGFFVLFNIGYAALLKDSNYVITSGDPSYDERRVLDMTYGSGIVIEGGIGYAF